VKRTFIRKGIRELWGHKVQYFSLILVIALGVASYSSMNNMMDARWNSFNAFYRESRFMDLQIQFEYGVTENASTVQSILDGDGIAEWIEHSEYRLTFDVFLNHTDEDGGNIKTTKGIIMGYRPLYPDGTPRDVSVIRPLFFSDDPVEFSNVNASECYVERKFATTYDLDGGDTIDVVRGQQFRSGGTVTGDPDGPAGTCQWDLWNGWS